MKKILFALLIASSAINSFGATCASMSGQTMQDLNTAGGCNIGTWNLGLWQFGSGGSSQTGYLGGNPALSDITVSFQTGLTNGAGATGFAVTFSDATGPGTLSNYFTAQALGPITQSANFKTIYTISGGPAIAQVSLSVVAPAPNLATTGDGLFGIVKFLVDPSLAPADPIIASNPINYAFGAAGSNPIPIYNNQASTIPLLGVVDSFQIQSGTNGFATLSSYTNTFYAADPTSGVPEPMTFVLMGLGLVGVAALRRRSS